MSHPNPSTALASVVVDELVACGVGFMAISPGSRSGALAIAAAGHPELTTRVIIDERSAAFHALGVARATGGPTAVLATSGTAPANILPAVVEADMAGVPLVVLSADRPAELRGVGANQTIDQVRLFGSKVRTYREIAAADSAHDLNRDWRELVSGLVAEAMGVFPGPVHLNIAFREPTVPVADDGRTTAQSYDFATPRLGGGAESRRPTPQEPELNLDAGRGVVIAGDGEYDRLGLLNSATERGWPVLATALSGLRGHHVVSAYHFVLARGIPPELRPSTVVAVGSIGPDQVLEDLVAAANSRIRVDLWGRHIDPRRNATAVLRSDPIAVLGRIQGSEPTGWAEIWFDTDRSMRSDVQEVFKSDRAMSGGSIAILLDGVERGALVVASSLPIREIDAHLTSGGPVFANRGASGIDGFISTALGVASVIPQTLALCGDLSFLHDANGFLHDSALDLTLVVIDNDGGGLFDSLPQARHAPDFERLFIAPPQRDIARLASFHGAGVDRVETPTGLVAAVTAGLSRPGLDVVVVPVDRGHDLDVRTRLYP